MNKLIANTDMKNVSFQIALRRFYIAKEICWWWESYKD